MCIKTGWWFHILKEDGLCPQPSQSLGPTISLWGRVGGGFYFHPSRVLTLGILAFSTPVPLPTVPLPTVPSGHRAYKYRLSNTQSWANTQGKRLLQCLLTSLF